MTKPSSRVGGCQQDDGRLSTGTELFVLHTTAVFQCAGRVVAPGLVWPSCASDRFSRELVPQTIGLLERAKAIEDDERLLGAHRCLHVVAREPPGTGQCAQ